MKPIYLALVLIVLLYSCKTVKTTTSSTQPSNPPIDSLIVEVTKKPDTVYLITQKGDTLKNLDEEVAISITRLLPDTVTISAVGDIMSGTNFPSKKHLPSNDGAYLWDAVKSFLQKSDITFGNHEGTILNSGGTQKICSNPKLCYLFRSPEYLAGNLKECGFDLLSLANNHANDFGEKGRKNTQKVLDSLKISHAGSIDQPYTITKIGHLKIGFCAFAPNRGTVKIYDRENIKNTITHLDSLTDIVFASLHAGAEGPKHRHITRKTEYYYGENRGNVYELAHLMVDYGADLVLGHGPHIVRAMEVYKNRIIAYSLGNFLTYNRFNLRNYAGEAPLLSVKTDAKGKFLSGKIHSFRQNSKLGPRIDSQLSSIKSIRRLSLEDFPENPVSIDEEGNIYYKEVKE